MAPALVINEPPEANAIYHQSSPILPYPDHQPLCQIITPVGMLGYGFDPELTKEALRLSAGLPTPTALILDSGSTDSGPSKLALGGMTCPRSAYERDFRQLLAISHEFSVPVLISSAGGDGTNAHVDEFLDIMREISAEQGNESYDFKTLAIYADVSKPTVFKSLKAGEIVGCGLSVPKLVESDIEDAVTIVAQMGPEPFLNAMESQPDFNVVIGGRAYDPSPYVAFCMYHARRKSRKLTDSQVGGFTHMGKIMECGALCATPKSQTAMATIYVDGTFDVKPLAADTICTPASVAAHSLYEKSRPDILAGPGGSLDLTKTLYEALPDDKSVRVRGGAFAWSRDSNLPYTVKLEAARFKGYRTMFMGGIRDPILIGQIDSVLEQVKGYVSQVNNADSGQFEIGFHVYGKNGIMGSLEPGDASYQPREIFLVGEILAATQGIATTVSSSARVACVHGSYPGQRGTGGNFAMGIGGKFEIELGPCAEFCIYHLMSIETGTEGAYELGGAIDLSAVRPLFSWALKQIGTAAAEPLANDPPTKNDLQSTEPKLHKTNVSTRDSLKHPRFSINPSLSTLADIAPTIRSKNSGPYDITLDVIFASIQVYELAKSSSLLSRSLIAKLYRLKEEEIIWCGFFDQAMAFKATIPRKRLVEKIGSNGKRVTSLEFVVSGGYMETDVHASQQYAGLLDIPLTKDIKKGIKDLLEKGIA